MDFNVTFECNIEVTTKCMVTYDLLTSVRPPIAPIVLCFRLNDLRRSIFFGISRGSSQLFSLRFQVTFTGSSDLALISRASVPFCYAAARIREETSDIELHLYDVSV
ncbi:hypothetical protein RvY_00217-2 [Ramazzottius varieornatus]|nr:hypothetical protein RvY_00217-2 [Ramazzottius varieornatus]